MQVLRDFTASINGARYRGEAGKPIDLPPAAAALLVARGLVETIKTKPTEVKI